MSGSPSISEHIELFFGEATAAEARVYARLANADFPADATLSGHLIGPECHFARTLPAKIPFQFRGRSARGELLAEAIVPDPCFWTPELPMLYRVEIEIGVRGEGLGAGGRGTAASERGLPSALTTSHWPLATSARWFGIRRLGVRCESLYLDGQRWVLRGVCRQCADAEELAAARAADAALVLSAADDEYCLAASRQGVPLVVILPGRGAQLADKIRRLCKWPAVFLVVLDAGQPADFNPRPWAPNLLFAVRHEADTPPGSSSWVHVLWCEIDGEHAIARCTDLPRPIIAVRRLPNHTEIPTARSACDRLQLEVASLGDFAAYIV